MKINGKFILVSALAILTIGFTDAAMATRGRVTGIPVRVQADSANIGFWDGFDVSGVTSFGTCPTDNNGLVAVTIARPGTSTSPDPSGGRLWALALAAEEAGRPVTLLLDDTDKDPFGYCEVIWMYM